MQGVPAGASPAVPSFSRRERIADGGVHLLGLVAVLAGGIQLLGAAIARPGWLTLAAIAPYLLGLGTSFACSAAYNMTPPGRLRQRLRRFDHAAIHLLIAGTYTPVMALSLGGGWSIALLALVWAGAAGGVALKLLAPGRHEGLGLALYLALGWVGLVALPPLTRVLSAWQLGTLGLGALLYTGGVAFHLAHRLPFHNALWHAMVLAAAACHYFLVLTLAVAGP
ncbi:hemolysin III family protein [Roseomonas gilardii]|uniref:Hemolysin III family protein n=1 Tax=Roseomonas gilardii TaxID=257708 RepID=A0ABU3MEE2_9PROT|nr:hemolysin III family protein [Roseomonas gilardii]MDT8330980.1 hemolysin III family protein [Roseomonas gilardii]